MGLWPGPKKKAVEDTFLEGDLCFLNVGQVHL